MQDEGMYYPLVSSHFELSMLHSGVLLLRPAPHRRMLGCYTYFFLQPEHEAFKQLLEAPRAEAQQIARRRFPVPKIVDCDQNGSQVCIA